MFCRRGQHCIHVEVVGVAAKLQSASGMTDDGGVRIRDCFKQAVGHLGRLLIEDRMHAGDD